MNTGNSDDKSEVESLYKIAIENLNKLKSSTQNTLHTSTSLKSFKSKSETAGFSLNESEISDNSKIFVLDGSADSEDITTQPAREFGGITSESKRKTVVAIPKSRGSDRTMTHQNLFATLKYAVEVFFDGKNISLNYFIEGCEEAKFMLLHEAKSQFTKIIRTKIVDEARRIIQDQKTLTIC